MDSDMTGVGTTTALVLAGVSALVLVALHLLAPRIRKLPLVPEAATASFAGGIAVAYVFLHLLPELTEGSSRLRELLDEKGARTPLLGLEIFLVALAGFLVFYGLERLAEHSQSRTAASGDATQGRSSTVPESGTGSRGIFRLHLASFLVYNAVIAYTLPITWRTSEAFAVLFTIAMGLHFVLTDRGLEEHYGARFDRWQPRALLALGLVVGYVVAALRAPSSGVLVSVLTAFLAGSILLNVFKEEIPSTRRSHFGWFLVGLAAYATLLGTVTALDNVHSPEKSSARAAAVLTQTAG